VIQRNTIDYLAPITADFGAECPAVTAEKLARLVKMLRRHGRARIGLSAHLTCAGAKVAAFSGEYVAMRLTPTGN
jgi:thioesterase domain-containing protein